MEAPRPRLLTEFARLGFAFLIAGSLVTAVAGIAELIGAEEPSRVGRKVLVPGFLLIWVLMLRLSRREALEACGLGDARDELRLVPIGLLCGAGSLIVMTFVLIALDARIIQPKLGPLALGVKVVLYLLQALVLGLLEESLFRGILHGRLRAAAGTIVAVGLGGVIFGVSHFLRPPKNAPPEAWWDTMPACIEGVGGAFSTRWRECVGLVLVGVILGVLRSGRRTILLPLGVHAGWVWVRFVSGKTLVEVKDVVRPDLLLFGSKRLYDGVLGWSALLLTLGIAWWIGLRSARSTSE